MQREQVQWPPMQGDRLGVGKGPAHARGGQAERTEMRQDRHLVAREALRQRDADPEPHRIAGRQHDHAPTAPCFDRVDGVAERACPGQPFGAVVGDHGKMPAAADHGLGIGDQLARNRADAVQAIGADADHRKPGFHGVGPVVARARPIP